MSNSIEFLRGQVAPEMKSLIETVATPLTYGDSSAVPGNATLNTMTGRSAIAATATACIVTNSNCVAASDVQVQLEDLDSVALQVKVVPAAGSFTVTAVGAANATTKFRWAIIA